MTDRQWGGCLDSEPEPSLPTHTDVSTAMPIEEPAHTLHASPEPPSGGRVRLLHVLGYAGISGLHAGQTGVERVVEQLLNGLDGFEQRVVYSAAGALVDRYRELAREVVTAEPQRRFDRRFVAALEALIRERNIDLVLSHGYLRNDLLTAIACRRTQRPHVVRRAVPLADEGLSALRGLVYGIPDGWMLRRCAHVIACSEVTRARMIETQRIPAARITAIPNGVRTPKPDAAAREQQRHALGLSDTALVVGGIGQLIERKRYVDLVEAVAHVRRTWSSPRANDLVCVILGRGPEHDALQQRARALDVPLHLPGFVLEPWTVMQCFDVAVLPSRAEGMPLSMLEAMALGIPNVVTRVAGAPEVIEEGRSGFLFKPGDLGTLSERLIELCADESLRLRIGAAGAERVTTRFSLPAMLMGFDRCLRGVLHTARGRR